MLPNNVANDVSFPTPCRPHISIESSIGSWIMYANEENDHFTKQLSIPRSTTPSLMSQNVYQGLSITTVVPLLFWQQTVE